MGHPIGRIAAFVERRFWLTLILMALLSFGIGRAARYASEASLARWTGQSVLAAGPLPSFEIKLTERLTGAKHHDKITLVITTARRADGAEAKRIEDRVSPDRPIVDRVLYFPATGTRITVDDTVRVRSTFHYRPNDSEFPHLQLMRADPATRCTKSLGRTVVHTGAVENDVVLGVPVVKLTTEGMTRQTLWFAPQLGCIEVMTRYDWRGQPGGPVSSTAIATPDYIAMREPDERLFHIPPDYEEVKPSERIDRLDAWMRENFPEVSPAQRKPVGESYRRSADEAYARHRPNANR